MKKRILLIGLGLVGAAACVYLVGKPAPVTAAPAYESETYYYADPNFTNEVGYRYVSCNSGNVTQGSPSPNRATFKGEKCSTGVPQNCFYCYGEYWDEEDEEWKTKRITPCYAAEFQGYPEC